MQRRNFNAALTALAAAPLARAQAWPDHPIRWVLSQPAASGPDNVARLLGEQLQKTWGQAVVIDNKPGGQNIIGAQAAARSPADGYTFYFSTTAALVTNPLLFKQLPYDPQKDFVPVAFVARSPFALVVAGTSPIKTLADFMARAKAEPGRLSLANEGPRTFSGMIARLFNARARIETNLVSYAAVGVGVQDLIGGHVDALVADVAAVAPLAKTGRVRLLATSAAQRVAGWDQVPALAETLPDFDLVGWMAMVAPTGTPAAVVQRVNADINRLLADPAIVEHIASIGPVVQAGMSSDQVADFLRAERSRWGQASREIGMLPE